MPWLILAKTLLPAGAAILAPAFRNLSPYNSFAFRALSASAILGLLTCLGFLLIHFHKSRTRSSQSDNLYRQLFHRANDAILIYQVTSGGQSGRFVEVNDTACRRLGYTREEILSLTPLALIPPEQLELAGELWDAISEQRHVLYEIVHLAKDGRRIPVEVNAHILDFHGVPTVMNIVRDITDRKKSERSLLESEERYRQLFKNSPLPMWVYDRRTLAFLAVNNTAITTYGYSREEFLGMTIRDIRDPDSWPALLEAVNKGPGPFRKPGIWKHRWKDGTPRDVEVTTHDLSIDGREARLVLANDVTERIQAEKRLSESEERLRAFFESGVVGILFAGIDGKLIEANDEFLRIIGYNREDLQRGELFWDKITPSEFLTLDREKLIEASERGVCTPYEKQYIRKDGTRIWALLGYVLLGNRRDEAVAFILDLSKRKEMEESERRARCLSSALADSTLSFLQSGDLRGMAQILIEHCRSITDAEFGLIFDLDRDGNARFLAVTNVNMATTAEKCIFDGMLAAEKEGSFIVSHEGNVLFAPIAEGRTILINEPQQTLCFGGNPPGDHRPIDSFLGTPLKVGCTIVGMIALVNRPGGFTEREQREMETFAQTVALAIQSARTELARSQAEEYLRQAQKMEAVGQLAGGVAHDFNNLLTVINGYGSLLLRALPHESGPYHDAEQIVEAGERAAALTRQLLAFSRSQVLEPKVLDLNRLILDLEKILRRLIREDIEIILSLADRLDMVKADPGQAEQIFMNLLVNARDALPAGGKITVETANVELDQAFVGIHERAIAGNYVMMSISDTGTGMTKEIRERVFEPFFTTKEQGRGTGLGLATVYGIIKQSGGYIKVDSQPGRGSTFRVYLPRTDETPEANVAFRPSHTSAAKTVLVVEDDEQVLRLAAAALKSQGYAVLQTQRPEEALKLFKRRGKDIDLLLTDVIMPELSGTRLAARLRKSRPHLKVLFMSGHAQPGEKDALPQDHHSGFIQKPFTTQNLLDKIHQVLAQRTI
jgi:PAS domain S-box-containing protein